MSSTSFGLTAQGFVPKTQQQIISELQTTLQATFGANINLGAESIFGQLVGIFSEREALLWLLAEAVYASQYPAGAEGTSVDNILALNNLQRLAASPTVTNPSPTLETDGLSLYGLVLYGTPGTSIPAGSTLNTSTSPVLSFTLDETVVIGTPANALQTLIYSNTPASGSYNVAILGPSGNTLTTQPINYNALPSQTQVSFAAAPTSGSLYLMLGNFVDNTGVTYASPASSLQSHIQTLGSPYGSVGVSGSFASGLFFNWGSSIANPHICLNGSFATFAASPTLGTFSLSLGGSTTSILPFSATAAQVQTAVAAISGYSQVQVAVFTGNGGSGYAFNWGTATPPTISFATNTTDQSTTSVGNLNTLNQSYTQADSIQAAINGLYDAVTGLTPYADVSVTGSSGVYVASFGGHSPPSGQPSSSSMPQAQMTIPTNNMFTASSTSTNVSVVVDTVGSAALGVGSATCTVNGPNSVVAGQLNVIGSPISGWTSVNNPLDCITGSNIESDSAALARRNTLLAAQANGPLQSIIEKVLQVENVTSVSGFQNTTDAALQNLSFSSPPTSGFYVLQLPTGQTGNIPYSAAAIDVQTALRGLSGYGSINVSGTASQGFTIDFNGSFGGQSQPLIFVAGNSTGVTPAVAFGRYPKSFEIVVQGGAPTAIAQAIFTAQPAGIASYGTPAAIPTGSVSVGSNMITSLSSNNNIVVGQTVTGPGLQLNSQVIAVSPSTVTLNFVAVGTYASVPLSFGWSSQVTDNYGNPFIINFSRPNEVLFYVSISLLTDQYLVPGVPNSGVNTSSKFSPSSIPIIQQDIVNIGNAISIGGLVVGYGTDGLIGAFNEVAGIIGYQLYFDVQPAPASNANIQLLPIQAPLFEQFNVSVSYV